MDRNLSREAIEETATGLPDSSDEQSQVTVGAAHFSPQKCAAPAPGIVDHKLTACRPHRKACWRNISMRKKVTRPVYY